MAAFLLSVTFLPALLCILPVKTPNNNRKLLINMSGLSDFLFARKKVVLIVTCIISVVLGASLQLNEFNDEVPKYLDKSISFRQASDFANESLGGLYIFSYS